MPDPSGIPSLKVFLDSLKSAKHSDYVASKVAHSDAFEEMRAHVLSLYEKTEAPHSFVDEDGAVFDCIPVEQQLALRGHTGPVPVAPDLPPIEAPAGSGDERRASLIVPPFGSGRKDRHGNEMQCPPGTIPMRRVTLEDLTRFGTLRDFFQKAPRGGADLRSLITRQRLRPPTAGHMRFRTWLTTADTVS
jgi:hypothetical protein